MEKYKVSILVAIYNIEKYLDKCIQSIINQDYNNLEIILVDDCSTDSSGEICDKYAKKDNRIKVLHHIHNTRLPGVRNDGLDIATGEYIVFVDGDDWLALDFVSYMIHVITKNNSDMGINLVNFTTRDNKQVEEKEVEIWLPERTTADLLYPRISIGAWNKIFKRDFIEKNKLRFLDLFTAEGFRFISDASQRANSIAVGYKKVYYYRLNNTESATTKYDINQSMTAIKVATDIKRDLLIRTPYVLDSINRHIWCSHFWNIRQIIALKYKKKYYYEYRKSIAYLRKNAFAVAKIETKFKTKIKCLLTGICPTLIARIINFKIKIELKKDLQHEN